MMISITSLKQHSHHQPAPLSIPVPDIQKAPMYFVQAPVDLSVAVGTLVVVRGLKHKLHYNNARGRILRAAHDDRCEVALIGVEHTIQVKYINLGFIPETWLKETPHKRFNQMGMLQHFKAPADSPTHAVPDFYGYFAVCHKPPTHACTQAFWGTECYPYIKQQLEHLLNTMPKPGYCLSCFHEAPWVPGLVWCDGTKADQVIPLNDQPMVGSTWWPALGGNCQHLAATASNWRQLPAIGGNC